MTNSTHSANVLTDATVPLFQLFPLFQVHRLNRVGWGCFIERLWVAEPPRSEVGLPPVCQERP